MSGTRDGGGVRDGIGESTGAVPHVLVCLPPAGASSAYYQGWLAAGVPCLSVLAPELPGRLSRFSDPPLTSIRAMAAHVLQEMDRQAGGASFSVFGHSMGALVAFELVRLMEDRGGPRPAMLHVSAHAAPHVPRRTGPDLASDAAIIRHFARLNGRPAPRDLVELMLPTIRADLAACAGYELSGGAVLTTPITAHHGARDPSVGPMQLAGWRRYTRGGFRVRKHPGDHHFPLVPASDLLSGIVRDAALA